MLHTNKNKQSGHFLVLLCWLGGLLAAVAALADGQSSRRDSVAHADGLLTNECADPAYQQFLREHPLLFEVGQVHPLELSADGRWLFALNTPLNCLAIFRVQAEQLQLSATLAVGLQPVSVRMRDANEVWVVNHLSDSISVIGLAGQPHVKQVLQTGDAPYDVVFAGGAAGEPRRAYVSLAARGQHHPTFDLHQLVSSVVQFEQGGRIRSEKLGQADIWVYDLAITPTLAGIINPFMLDARSLAVSADGETVFAAGFLSGNGSTTVMESAPPSQQPVTAGHMAPVSRAVIVREQDGRWLDGEGHDHTDSVRISLPDTDVIAMDASRAPAPFHHLGGRAVTRTNRELIRREYSGMGSVLFALAVDGERLWLSSLDSHNLLMREENLQGRAVSNQLVVQEGDQRRSLSLDTADTRLPLPGAITVGRESVYVASYGAARIGVLPRHAPLATLGVSRVLDLADQRQPLAALGIAGMVELPSGALAVLSRLDNTLRVINPAGTGTVLASHALYTPESPAIVAGRHFLYDANAAGNGQMACASCHIFGDTDKLAWDLGSAAGLLERNDGPFVFVKGALRESMRDTLRYLPLTLDPAGFREGDLVPLDNERVTLCYKGNADGLYQQLRARAFGNQPCVVYISEPATRPEAEEFTPEILQKGHQWAAVSFPYFHPLKGPMMTQTLYGMQYGGPMHHRGDRTGREPAADNHCPPGKTLEERAFKEFNQPCSGQPGSFVTLLGAAPLSAAQMDLFTGFALAMHFPPNPHRPLDNRVPAHWLALFNSANTARDLTRARFFEYPGLTTCNNCHELDVAAGRFGSSHVYYSAPILLTQDFEVPDMRTFYRKLGLVFVDYRKMFATMAVNDPVYDDRRQTTGYGLFHSGFVDGIEAVFDPAFFAMPADSGGRNMDDRLKLFYFLAMFDTDVFPMAGQQRTVEQGSLADHALLADHRFCRSYLFAGQAGQRRFARLDAAVPADTAGNARTVVTCYPVLQAGSGRP